MLYTLASVEGEQSFDLKSGVAQVIGRALTSDIPVFDPTISRRHAALTTDDAGVEVRDLGSSNGTFVNGAKISKARALLAPNARYRVRALPPCGCVTGCAVL